VKETNTVSQIHPFIKRCTTFLFSHKVTEISDKCISSFFRVKRLRQTTHKQTKEGGMLADTLEGS
jgi:hypothetical protein